MDRIDELLLDWYEWSQGYNPGTDYQAFDSTCAHFRSSRQWLEHDDIDAEIEWSRKKSVGKVIEPMIQKLDLRARVAVNTAMRNFSAGASVWSSVRVDAVDVEYLRAKRVLCPMLVAVGLLDKKACQSVLVVAD
ncbi:hypothetical protein [Paraburkholderia silvatlantica]|uniref:Phage protein n=1 Tax=Paraburkholderia silvatlantica TaxID=321895 RepID=A0ABR6FNK8_9BURK|nr:hypothetical protein [Paraburkholderia silvatlantica]MBB2928380.1 hypothetical protein [Paraburkholderia silvatlantica]PVY34575.1 hypothetical protein C7411_107111 [Paraburkholderia silvatlantica]PXW38790.1 hypothetical protein C7413_107111 [Paraburkholderia silvatlantica]